MRRSLFEPCVDRVRESPVSVLKLIENLVIRAGECPMPDLLVSMKAFITVSSMCELCSISRSRWYDLTAAGVFPKPILHPSSKRPMYDRRLQEKCLEIIQTGIGANGEPVLFNRKPRKDGAPKPPKKIAQAEQSDHADIAAALKGLGLVVSVKAVGEAVAALYPTGLHGHEQGDVVRKVFLHLQQPKK